MKTCRWRHRWSRWAYVKFEVDDGWPPEVIHEEQFRMCRNCGHQEVRERVKT